MTPDNEMIQKIIEGARLNLKMPDGLLPVFFIGNDKSFEIVASHFENNMAKDMAARVVKETAKRIDAEFVLLVSESYLVDNLSEAETKAFQANGSSVKDHPRAREVVLFSLETKTRKQMGHANILPNREMGEVEWMEPDDSQGRFSEFLGKKPTKH